MCPDTLYGVGHFPLTEHTLIGLIPRSSRATALNDRIGQVAQLVEQRTENPRVGGSIPPLATILFKDLRLFREIFKKPLREFCVT